MYELKEMLER